MSSRVCLLCNHIVSGSFIDFRLCSAFGKTYLEVVKRLFPLAIPYEVEAIKKICLNCSFYVTLSHLLLWSCDTRCVKRGSLYETCLLCDGTETATFSTNINPGSCYLDILRDFIRIEELGENINLCYKCRYHLEGYIELINLFGINVISQRFDQDGYPTEELNSDRDPWDPIMKSKGTIGKKRKSSAVTLHRTFHQNTAKAFPPTTEGLAEKMRSFSVLITDIRKDNSLQTQLGLESQGHGVWKFSHDSLQSTTRYHRKKRTPSSESSKEDATVRLVDTPNITVGQSLGSDASAVVEQSESASSKRNVASRGGTKRKIAESESSSAVEVIDVEGEKVVENRDESQTDLNSSAPNSKTGRRVDGVPRLRVRTNLFDTSLVSMEKGSEEGVAASSLITNVQENSSNRSARRSSGEAGDKAANGESLEEAVVSTPPRQRKVPRQSLCSEIVRKSPRRIASPVVQDSNDDKDDKNRSRVRGCEPKDVQSEQLIRRTLQKRNSLNQPKEVINANDGKTVSLRRRKNVKALDVGVVGEERQSKNTTELDVSVGEVAQSRKNTRELDVDVVGEEAQSKKNAVELDVKVGGVTRRRKNTKELDVDVVGEEAQSKKNAVELDVNVGGVTRRRKNTKELDVNVVEEETKSKKSTIELDVSVGEVTRRRRNARVLNANVVGEEAQSKTNTKELDANLVGEVTRRRKNTRELDVSVVSEVAQSKKNTKELDVNVVGVTRRRKNTRELDVNVVSEVAQNKNTKELDVNVGGVTRRRKNARELDVNVVSEVAQSKKITKELDANLVGEVTRRRKNTRELEVKSVAEEAQSNTKDLDANVVNDVAQSRKSARISDLNVAGEVARSKKNARELDLDVEGEVSPKRTRVQEVKETLDEKVVASVAKSTKKERRKKEVKLPEEDPGEIQVMQIVDTSPSEVAVPESRIPRRRSNKVQIEWCTYCGVQLDSVDNRLEHEFGHQEPRQLLVSLHRCNLHGPSVKLPVYVNLEEVAALKSPQEDNCTSNADDCLPLLNVENVLNEDECDAYDALPDSGDENKSSAEDESSPEKLVEVPVKENTPDVVSGEVEVKDSGVSNVKKAKKKTHPKMRLWDNTQPRTTRCGRVVKVTKKYAENAYGSGKNSNSMAISAVSDDVVTVPPEEAVNDYVEIVVAKENLGKVMVMDELPVKDTCISDQAISVVSKEMLNDLSSEIPSGDASEVIAEKSEEFVDGDLPADVAEAELPQLLVTKPENVKVESVSESTTAFESNESEAEVNTLENDDAGDSSGNLKTELDHIDGDVDEVEGDADEVEGDADEVEGDADEVEGGADEVEGGADEVEGGADEVEGDVDQIEGDVDEAEGDVGEAEGDVDEAEGDVDQAEGDVDQVEGDVDEAEDDVDQVEGDVDEAEGDVDHLGIADPEDASENLVGNLKAFGADLENADVEDVLDNEMDDKPSASGNYVDGLEDVLAEKVLENLDACSNEVENEIGLQLECMEDDNEPVNDVAKPDEIVGLDYDNVEDDVENPDPKLSEAANEVDDCELSMNENNGLEDISDGEFELTDDEEIGKKVADEEADNVGGMEFQMAMESVEAVFAEDSGDKTGDIENIDDSECGVGDDVKEVGSDVGDDVKEVGSDDGDDVKEVGSDDGDDVKEVGSDVGDDVKEVGSDEEEVKEVEGDDDDKGTLILEGDYGEEAESFVNGEDAEKKGFADKDRDDEEEESVENDGRNIEESGLADEMGEGNEKTLGKMEVEEEELRDDEEALADAEEAVEAEEAPEESKEIKEDETDKIGTKEDSAIENTKEVADDGETLGDPDPEAEPSVSGKLCEDDIEDAGVSNDNISNDGVGCTDTSNEGYDSCAINGVSELVNDPLLFEDVNVVKSIDRYDSDKDKAISEHEAVRDFDDEKAVVCCQ